MHPFVQVEEAEHLALVRKVTPSVSQMNFRPCPGAVAPSSGTDLAEREEGLGHLQRE